MRVAILTFESPQANAIVRRVLAERRDDVCGIVRSTVIIPRRSAWQGIRFVLRHCAFAFLAWKAAELGVTHAAAVMCRLSGRDPAVVTLDRMATEADVPLVGTSDVNGPETVATLRDWRPDLVVSVYFNQRIREPVRDLCPGAVINVHGGMLPEARGLFPYFWALVQGDSVAGATVHWIDEDFDTGEVLAEQRFPIAPDDTVHSLAWRSAQAAGDLLLGALDAIEAGKPPRRSQDDSRARYFSWPTAADVRTLRERQRRFGSLREVWRAGVTPVVQSQRRRRTSLDEV